jgi:hypothetical protein
MVRIDIQVAVRGLLVEQHVLHRLEGALLEIDVRRHVRRQAEAEQRERARAVVDGAAGGAPALLLVEGEAAEQVDLGFAGDGRDADRKGCGLADLLVGLLEARREDVDQLEVRVVLADLRHRHHARRVDVALVGRVDCLPQRRQDLAHDLLLRRTQRVLRRRAPRGAEVEVVTARHRAAAEDRVAQADERILVELPPVVPRGEVFIDLGAATAARGRAATAGGAGGAARGRTGRAAGGGAAGRRCARASRATGGRAGGTGWATAAAARARRNDVARATVLTTVGAADVRKEGDEPCAAQTGEDQLLHVRHLVESAGARPAGRAPAI